MTQEKQFTRMIWRKGTTFDATTTTGHHIVVDTPPPSGNDSVPKPMELLLTGLAGCTALDVLSILKKKQEPVQGLEVYVEGKRATGHPMIYTDIEIVYRVTGQVKPESIAHAIELSETKYCGAAAMLGKSAQITTRFEIILEPELAAA